MLHDLVFLFDVDNTLLDNDRVQADLGVYLGIEHGAAIRDRYWEIFEALRGELGYADYLGAIERHRLEEVHVPRFRGVSIWLAAFPFADRLYPGARMRCAMPGSGRWWSSCPTATRCSSHARSTAPACGRRSTATC